jgi:glycosyltransferase involved in cell wall biosynthesis
MSAPEISIIIPVYNEEGILHSAVVDLRERLAPFGWSYEIILAENGSRDRTVAIAEALEAKYPEVRHISVPAPNYGKALRLGAESCLVEKDVFASEFVIRAYREALRVVEIPTRVLEKRPPTINLLKRVPNVLRSIAKLTWAIRVRG